MKIHLAVIGAGSLLGRNLCRRAVRIGWDVHAFSVCDLNTVYKQTKTNRQKIFYPSSAHERDWVEHITWNCEPNYDEDFNNLKEEIRNVTGLVYFHEETPLLKSGKRTFKENVVDLAKHAGNWSVRHFVAVESENCLLNKETEEQIGQNANPFMIISLLRPGKVYSYDQFTSCFPVYKNRTLRSIGFDTKPVHAINAETVSKCITTLIHNTNDPNIYRILEGNDMEQYLTEEKVAFDSPDFDYRYPDNDDNEIDIDENENENEDNKQSEDKTEKNDANMKMNKKNIMLGYNKMDDINNESNIEMEVQFESVRDEQENPNNKIL